MHQTLKQTLSHSLMAVITCLFISWHGSATAQGASPTWQVNLPKSSLTFNTTKASMPGVGGATETMRFKLFKGGMDAQGNIQLDIDLTSIDSGISIRDERLQTMFWNVAEHPSVKFRTKINPDDLQKINAGNEAVDVTIEGDLTMAGQTKPIKTALKVVPSRNMRIVSTRQAIVINANDFGMSSGVEALRAVMGLNYLSTSAPVTFHLELVPLQADVPPSAW